MALADPFAAYDPTPVAATPTPAVAPTPANSNTPPAAPMVVSPGYEYLIPKNGVESTTTPIDVSGAKTGTTARLKVVPTPAAIPVSTNTGNQGAPTARTSGVQPMADPFAAFDQPTTPAVPAAPAVPTAPAQTATATPATPPVPGTAPPAATGQPAPILQPEQAKQQPWYQSLFDSAKAADAALHGVTDEAAHAATFGLDEVVSPIPAAIAKTITTGMPFSKAYDEVVQQQRNERKTFEANHPVASTVAGLAGGFGTAGVTAPLFGEAAQGAGLAAKAVNYGRNIAAGAVTGAAQGAGMTEGDLSQRLEGAKEGAEFGGALSAATPLISGIASGVRGTVRALTPGRQIDRITGNILNETANGPVTFEPSPLGPNAPLNIAQASGSPELAGLVDTRRAENVASLKREQTEQNRATIQATPGGPGTNVAPEQSAALGSQKFTRGVQSAERLSNTEEKRVWNTPALRDKNLTSASSKQAVADTIQRIQTETPGLHDAITNSGAIRGVIRDLEAMPDKVSANELNSIASRLKAIGRDPRVDGGERLVAKQLASAAHDGLWNAPEVTGRPAQVISGLPERTEMHTLPGGDVVPVQIAATPDTIIPETKPIPSIVRDLNNARAFTKREAETFGHASFDNIVGRNSYGNQTVQAGTSANRFFDFSNGVEKPGAIKDVTNFLTDIGSQWRRLGQLGTQYDPAHVDMAKTELREGLREYIASKFLATVSSSNLDARSQQMISAAKASDWLGNNRKMLEQTGVYSPAEIDAWKRIYDYTKLINRGNNLGTPVGSATFSRLSNNSKWLDLFIPPLVSKGLGYGIGAAAGAAMGGAVGDAALGAVLGSGVEGGYGLGGNLVRAIYSSSRQKVMERLDEAIANPDIAKDLMQRANQGTRFGPATRQWLRSWLIGQTSREAVNATQNQQPEPVQ